MYLLFFSFITILYKDKTALGNYWTTVMKSVFHIPSDWQQPFLELSVCQSAILQEFSVFSLDLK